MLKYIKINSNVDEMEAPAIYNIIKVGATV